MENQTLVKEICPTTTQEWIANGALLVDVRETNEVVELSFDIPNIMHIPLTQFEERFKEIPKNKEIVMVCKSGGRSLRAAGYLVNHEYTRVVNMKYGMIRWAQKGFPTKGDTASVLGNAQDGGCCGTTESSDEQSCCDNAPKSDDGKNC